MKKAISLIIVALSMMFAFGGCGMGDAASDVGADISKAESDMAGGSTTNGTVTDKDGIIGNEGSSGNGSNSSNSGGSNSNSSNSSNSSSGNSNENPSQATSASDELM